MINRSDCTALVTLGRMGSFYARQWASSQLFLDFTQSVTGSEFL